MQINVSETYSMKVEIFSIILYLVGERNSMPGEFTCSNKLFSFMDYKLSFMDYGW